MVTDSDEVFIHYSLLTAWWDEHESLDRIWEGKIKVNEDFTVEKKNDSYIITKEGGPMPKTRLFEFHLNRYEGKKRRAELDIVAKFTPEQFDVVYGAFINLIEDSFADSRQDSIIKNAVEEPMEVETTDILAKKYRNAKTDD